MDCASCKRSNRAGARFCAGCGGTLAPRCPACGAETALDAQFCDACGGSLAAAPAAGGESAGTRKVVTILFADLVGSTSLQERLDAESTRRVMERYYAAMRGPVEAHGGTVVQLLGDGVMCAFGVPNVAEDDAIRAVRAAVAMQQAFREFARDEGETVGDLGLRIAVNTGEVVTSDERPQGIGDPLNVAGRLQQEAREGDVLIGEATRRLVSEQVTLEHFGTFTLKGRAEPVPAYRVVSLERPAGAPALAFVGREEELRRLMSVYEAAVATPGARLAAILGSPGLGKSRLLAELARRLGERATVLTARCDPAGGATFAPLADALRIFLGIDAGAEGDALRAVVADVLPDEAERSRIAAGIAALLTGTPASTEETFFVVRRLLAAIAVVQPVVLALDDVQWAEPLLLDLTEHLVQWSAGVPLLVLIAARPELRDTRSSLAVPGELVADVVTLAGLDAGAATRLAANVVGADELPAALAGRVLAASEGNPLFVGELVRMLVQDGALKREGDRWTTSVALSDLEMPPTIQALLAARIERLRPEERTILERAAVIGRQFSRAAVAQLLPREIGDLDARLESLRRSELVEPDTGWFLGEPALRFHHALIRDAAYRRVLRGTRAELHGRFADWIAARVGDSVEQDETIGWHLEQAHQHLRELGPIDAKGRALGERAAHYLAAAGRRALARDDVPVAGSLLGRALARLDLADPARADLALDWCEALLAAGEVGPAAGALSELARFTASSDRLRAWHTCFAGQLAVLTDPQSLRATADAVAAAAEALASAGDIAGEAKAHYVHALALSRLGKGAACEAALDLALAAARRADNRRLANAVLSGVPLAALWGPSPVTRASGRCLDVVRVLRITQGAPAVEAVALRCQAVLEGLRGRGGAARRMIASSRRMVEELGLTQQLLETDVFSGHIDLLEGDALAAERGLRGAYDGLREHGLGIDAARAAALLARALLAQGRAAEAETLSGESEALAGDDLQAAIAWRGVRAEALARRGEHALAVEFARAAVEIAAGTDALLHHADARLALAIALRAAGSGAEADTEERRAIELWEAKGATTLAERARRGVAPPVAAPPADTGRPPSPTRIRPKVRPNAATAHAARFDAIVKARDADALAQLLSDSVAIVHHPTRTELGPEGGVSMLTGLLRAQDLSLYNEPLATLGDSLVLTYVHSSLTALGSDDVAPFGAIDYDLISVMEVDGAGRQRRAEVFDVDRLNDAVARLYQLHAELQPDGPARVRATATARSVEAVLCWADPSAFRAAFAPDLEFVDHRQLGFGDLGAQQVRALNLALHEAAEDVTTRVDELIELRGDGLVARRTFRGTDRVSGGVFERELVELWCFGSDGLLRHLEQFDCADAGDALARFEELAAESPVADRRRVRLNAATENAALTEAAVSARDFEAFRNLFTDDAQAIHHPTGRTYEEQRALPAMLQTVDLSFTNQPLATLGESLALCRTSLSFSEIAAEDGTFGATTNDWFILMEVDAGGRRRHSELFGTDRLGDAIVRLYQRSSELLPAGSARERAEATARSVSVLPLQGSFDIDCYVSAFAADVEWIDHRTVGMGSVRGAEVVRKSIRSFLDLTAESINRTDDILGLRADALLVRRTNTGTDRLGGLFERDLAMLWVFGGDGLVTSFETFDADHADQALARFDELATAPKFGSRRVTVGSDGLVSRFEQFDVDHAAEPLPPRRRVRANAATEHAARLEAAIAARDVDALPALLADGMVVVNHAIGVEHGREGVLFSLRSLLNDRSTEFRSEPLATLGDSMALCRWSVSGSSAEYVPDAGAWDRAELFLFEVDAKGRRGRTEVFAADRFGDAIIRLYERYAELPPDGPERTRATEMACSVAILGGLLTPDRVAAAIDPAVELLDHRPAGFGSLRGAQEVARAIATGFEVGEDLAERCHDVLAAQPNALLVSWVTSGRMRDGGGEFEWPHLRLCIAGAKGRFTRIETFGAHKVGEALARFEELSSERAAPQIENLATRAAAAGTAAMNARDWDRFAASYQPGFRSSDRRRMVQLELDRAQHLELMRAVFESGQDTELELLATRGSRLALFHLRWLASDGTVGPSDGEFLMIPEVDAAGGTSGLAAFDLDDLDAAYTELDRRYATGEAAPYAEIWENFWRRSRAVDMRDWDRLATLLPADLITEDHRPIRWGVLHSRDEYLAMFRALGEPAPDDTVRLEHVLGLDTRGVLAIVRRSGSREGGTFEIPVVTVNEVGLDGRVQRLHLYDLEQLDEARACYEALRRDSPAPPLENLATRATAAALAALKARDWDGFTAAFQPGFRNSDRRRMVQLELDRAQYLESLRSLFEMNGNTEMEVLATRGSHLALFHYSWLASDDHVGPSGGEFLMIIEVDDASGAVGQAQFDADAVDAAYAELERRFTLAGFAELPLHIPPNAATRTSDRIPQAFEAGDWDGLARLCAPAMVWDDRRRQSLLVGDRDMFISNIRVVLSQGRRLSKTLLATAEDRLSLHHLRWAGASSDVAGFETENLSITEVDADGRVVAIVSFDADDRRAASTELRERFARSDAAPYMLSAAFLRALGDHDLAGCRAALPDDFRFCDHRRAGAGLLEGADAYVAFLGALFEQSPDVQIEPLYYVAAEKHGFVSVAHSFGTLAGGGPFESVFVQLVTPLGGELFEVDDLELARARFAELRPDPLRIPPNAAARAAERVQVAFEAQDWEAITELHTPAFVYEDRRRRTLLVGGREMLLDTLRFIREQEVRVERTLLATAGDHLALYSARWTGSRDAPDIELETLRIMEIDAEGRFTAVIIFDSQDRRTANAELRTRFARSEVAPWMRSLDLERALLHGDLAGIRAAAPAGLTFHDRRRLGAGRLDGAGYVTWLEALFEQSPDTRIEPLYYLAAEKFGTLYVGHTTGTLTDGGAFEIVWVQLNASSGVELFDIDDLELARARFEELRP